ncbi:eukaryotic translation initiation factor 3 subunit K-like [Ctenocephalides felis]|uniref:eukaryotic translation initiation factor 3 subunit K-like n=1 Tax=Ctenocephalides felis TaxID=7515 RepID=UPI000E6E4B7C|nr:eukaryotic translation initiation factor 3 subunit K-like [Ctenocephalides felis]XP_026478926.1 eukaryotic translation initiation factor 3 subunit K-like [Ctenocephalides felis]
MGETMKQVVASMLKGIERYNPENLPTLEQYVEIQSRDNVYDLEANLAVLKMYQFNPSKFNLEITCQILLKALTNFPHSDFILCKCLLLESQTQQETISQIMYLGDILEQCDFATFWARVHAMPELCSRIQGFNDSIRKFVCHVVGITFQTIDQTNLANLLGGVDNATLNMWIKKYGWKKVENNLIFIANQDENIKTKNITETIDFENLAPLMAACL